MLHLEPVLRREDYFELFFSAATFDLRWHSLPCLYHNKLANTFHFLLLESTGVLQRSVTKKKRWHMQMHSTAAWSSCRSRKRFPDRMIQCWIRGPWLWCILQKERT